MLLGAVLMALGGAIARARSRTPSARPNASQCAARVGGDGRRVRALPATATRRRRRPSLRLALDSARGVRIFSGIQPTGRKHLGNYIGAIRQYVEGQDRAGRRRGDLLHRRPARDLGRLRPGRAARAPLRHDRDPDRGRARSRALHPLPPVRRPRAHRALLAAVGGHRPRRSQPHAPSSRRSRRSSASWSRRRCSSIPCCRPPTCSPTRPARSRSARTSASTSS